MWWPVCFTIDGKDAHKNFLGFDTMICRVYIYDAPLPLVHFGGIVCGIDYTQIISFVSAKRNFKGSL